MKCLIQGLALKPDPKPARSPLVQFPLPPTASETWTHEKRKMCFLKGKIHRRNTENSCRDAEERESKAKGKMRRGLSVHWDPGHESIKCFGKVALVSQVNRFITVARGLVIVKLHSALCYFLTWYLSAAAGAGAKSECS